MTALILLFLAAPPVKGVVPENNDEPFKIADAYAKAVTGQGDQKVRELLLGGMTFMAETVGYDNYKFVTRDPARTENGDLAEVVKEMSTIDKAGRKALNDLASGNTGKVGDEGEQIGEVTAATAAKMMAPSKKMMAAFTQKHPVFAYVARMDKEVYWHPKNPIRPLIESTPKKGHYTLEVHRFVVESIEGPLKTKKTWKLRVLRLQVDGGFDTGWKILPAADWNPEE